MKRIVDRPWLIVWEHDGLMAVWIEGCDTAGCLRYGTCVSQDRGPLVVKRDGHEDLLARVWHVEVPATEDDVGKMVMTRDFDSVAWNGPRLLRAVLLDRAYPFVCNLHEGVASWKYARLATEEELKGSE